MGMLGKYHSEETKKKMRKARLARKKQLGYINSPEARKKMSKVQKERFKDNPVSEETKRRISAILRGKKKPPFTEKHKRKISEALKGKPQPWNAGEKCHFWKGGMMEKILVKCTVCGKINLARKGWFMKRITPYKCRKCCNKGKKKSLEYRLKSSLIHRKYSLNEFFFTKVDNEKKAYWLGFLTGDGNITGNKIRLQLANRDIKHLKKFKKAVGWTGKDYYIKRTDQTGLAFRSLCMVTDLARYSITPRKTYIVRFPKISESLERHFIRGVFDADGCINRAVRTTRGKSGQIYMLYGGEFNIEGNREFVLAVQSRLTELGLPRNSINYQGKNINRVRYGGINQLRIIYDYLYKDATIFLERKKKLFENILSNYRCEKKLPLFNIIDSIKT